MKNNEIKNNGDIISVGSMTSQDLEKEISQLESDLSTIQTKLEKNQNNLNEIYKKNYQGKQKLSVKDWSIDHKTTFNSTYTEVEFEYNVQLGVALNNNIVIEKGQEPSLTDNYCYYYVKIDNQYIGYVRCQNKEKDEIKIYKHFNQNNQTRMKNWLISIAKDKLNKPLHNNKETEKTLNKELTEKKLKLSNSEQNLLIKKQEELKLELARKKQEEVQKRLQEELEKQEQLRLQEEERIKKEAQEKLKLIAKLKNEISQKKEGLSNEITKKKKEIDANFTTFLEKFLNTEVKNDTQNIKQQLQDKIAEIVRLKENEEEKNFEAINKILEIRDIGLDNKCEDNEFITTILTTFNQPFKDAEINNFNQEQNNKLKELNQKIKELNKEIENYNKIPVNNKVKIDSSEPPRGADFIINDNDLKKEKFSNFKTELLKDIKDQLAFTNFLNNNLKKNEEALLKEKEQPVFMIGLAPEFLNPYNIFKKYGFADVLEKEHQDLAFAFGSHAKENLETYLNELLKKAETTIKNNNSSTTEDKKLALQEAFKTTQLKLYVATGGGKTKLINSLFTSDNEKYYTNQIIDNKNQERSLCFLGKMLAGENNIVEMIHCGYLNDNKEEGYMADFANKITDKLANKADKNTKVIIALDEYHIIRNKEEAKEIIKSFLKEKGINNEIIFPVQMTATRDEDKAIHETNKLSLSENENDKKRLKDSKKRLKERHQSSKNIYEKLTENVKTEFDFTIPYRLVAIDESKLGDEKKLLNYNLKNDKSEDLEIGEIINTKFLANIGANRPNYIMVPPYYLPNKKFAIFSKYEGNGKNPDQYQLLSFNNEKEYQDKLIEINQNKEVNKIIEIFDSKNLAGGDYKTFIKDNPILYIHNINLLDNTYQEDENLSNKQKIELIAKIKEIDSKIKQIAGRPRVAEFKVVMANNYSESLAKISKTKEKLLEGDYFKYISNGNEKKNDLLINYDIKKKKIDKYLNKLKINDEDEKQNILTNAALMHLYRDDKSIKFNSYLDNNIDNDRYYKKLRAAFSDLNEEQIEFMLNSTEKGSSLFKKGYLEKFNATKTLIDNINNVVKQEIETRNKIYNIDNSLSSAFKNIKNIKTLIEIGEGGKITFNAENNSGNNNSYPISEFYSKEILDKDNLYKDKDNLLNDLKGFIDEKIKEEIDSINQNNLHKNKKTTKLNVYNQVLNELSNKVNNEKNNVNDKKKDSENPFNKILSDYLNKEQSQSQENDDDHNLNNSNINLKQDNQQDENDAVYQEDFEEDEDNEKHNQQNQEIDQKNTNQQEVGVGSSGNNKEKKKQGSSGNSGNQNLNNSNTDRNQYDKEYLDNFEDEEEKDKKNILQNGELDYNSKNEDQIPEIISQENDLIDQLNNIANTLGKNQIEEDKSKNKADPLQIAKQNSETQQKTASAIPSKEIDDNYKGRLYHQAKSFDDIGNIYKSKYEENKDNITLTEAANVIISKWRIEINENGKENNSLSQNPEYVQLVKSSIELANIARDQFNALSKAISKCNDESLRNTLKLSAFNLDYNSCDIDNFATKYQKELKEVGFTKNNSVWQYNGLTYEADFLINQFFVVRNEKLQEITKGKDDFQKTAIEIYNKKKEEEFKQEIAKIGDIIELDPNYSGNALDNIINKLKTTNLVDNINKLNDQDSATKEKKNNLIKFALMVRTNDNKDYLETKKDLEEILKEITKKEITKDEADNKTLKLLAGAEYVNTIKNNNIISFDNLGLLSLNCIDNLIEVVDSEQINNESNFDTNIVRVNKDQQSNEENFNENDIAEPLSGHPSHTVKDFKIQKVIKTICKSNNFLGT